MATDICNTYLHNLLQKQTRKHSSRIRVARLSIVCASSTRCYYQEGCPHVRSAVMATTSREGPMCDVQGWMGWDWGWGITVMSDTSWLVVTQGSPVDKQTDRQTDTHL